MGGATRAELQQRDIQQRPCTGNIDSKRRCQKSKDQYAGSQLKLWNICMKEARQKLGFQDRFIPVGGPTADGKRLWEIAHALKRVFHAQHEDGV